MRIVITAGPTREYIDRVRFITNASSGRMGCAVAEAAATAGHEVVLLTSRPELPAPPSCRVVPFVTVDDLKKALHEHFPACDALVMAAAVGDFRPERVFPGKIRRADGPITIRLLPTEDLLAGLAPIRRPGQIVVAFAVEEGDPESIEVKARAEMAAKGADLTVVNTPSAMGADDSLACILSRDGRVADWARRPKRDLAREIVSLLKPFVLAP